MPWKKVTVTYGETGVGIEDRVETEWVFGDEIDGTFVPYGTKSDGYIQALIKREKDAQAAKQAEAAPAQSTGEDSAA